MAYIVVAFILLFLFVLDQKRNKLKIFYIASTIIILFIGLRAPVVGADTFNYVRYFEGITKQYNDDTRDIEPLFAFYNGVVGSISNNGTYYLMFNAIFCLLPLFVLVKNYSQNRILSLLLFFLSFVYLHYFVALRQAIGLAILLWGVILVEKNVTKKYLKYTILFITASFIHSSSLFVGFLYIVSHFITLRRKHFIYIIIVSSVLGLSMQYFDIASILMYIGGADFSLLYRYSESLRSSGQYDNISQYQELIRFVVKPSMIGLIVFFYIDNNKIHHWFSKIYLIGIIISNVFYFIPLISRIVMGFEVFDIIVITWCFPNYKYKYTMLKKYIFLAYMILLFRGYMIGNIYFDKDSKDRMQPYLFFFEEYKNESR